MTKILNSRERVLYGPFSTAGDTAQPAKSNETP